MKNGLLKNTLMLYLLTAAKIILPLVTLPYLTRTLNESTYGVVAYVKAFMSYIQLFIDFGFVLSATKHVTLAKGNKNELGRIVWDTIAEKLILGAGTFGALLLCMCFIPLLKENALFAVLYFVSILLSVFLVDFYFRGIEKMEMVSIPYIISKIATTVLTLVLIKSDRDIMMIPILEIIGTLAACLFVIAFLFKDRLPFFVSNIRVLLRDIKESFVFFASNFATTFLGSFTTIIAGAALPTREIAYWSVCMQLVSAVKVMYSPITNSLYPDMLQKPRKRTLNKAMKIIMPLVVAGCVFTFVFARIILTILGGAKYAVAAGTLRLLIPILFFSFPSMLYGWPALGAIGKEKQTTLTTVIAAIFQIVSMALLLMIRAVSLKTLAISCGMAECVLLISRYYYYRKNISLFK